MSKMPRHLLLCSLALAGLMPAAAQAAPTTLPCASAEQARLVREFYGTRPGVPLPVPSRRFDISELTAASAIAPEQSIGIAAPAQITRQIWKSIEAWGASTRVKLVLAPGGKHAYALDSLVPINLSGDTDPYIDANADEGRGIHTHIQVSQVAAIFATDIPTADPAFRTRAISLFGADGHLILGVYASIKQEAFDPLAIEGFDKSWRLIRSMPRICG